MLQCVYCEDNIVPSEEELSKLSASHYRKIDLSDGIYVVNIDGYIGLSVKKEIEYAEKNGKEVLYHCNLSIPIYIASENFSFVKKLKTCKNLNTTEENMTDYSYLDVLINEVKELRSKTAFIEIDITKCGISYMPTKKTSFVGFKQGYGDYLIKIQKGIKETEKIRSTTKDYLRLIKNKDDELIQIEHYSHGKLDYLFQVHWIEGARYLFPYSSGGGFYPTYTYVTKYEDNCVVEEYMVDGSQIVYETYTKNSNGKTDYNYINYVSGGKYPVLEERKGKFYFNPLTYVEKFRDSWLNHREV